jgi:hypothetical protein
MSVFYRILAWLMGIRPVRRPEFDPASYYPPQPLPTTMQEPRHPWDAMPYNIRKTTERK